MADNASAKAKKAAPAKATTKSAAVKTPTAKKSTARSASRKMSKGDVFECELCGLSMIVDECGDVMAAREVVCCNQPMKSKSAKAK